MPTANPSALIAEVGVTRTEMCVQEKFGWIFRPQPKADYGIDAQVEVVDGTDVRGRLLALQIKTGESHFNEPTTEGWWYRPDHDHVRYWLNHSLPVAVVLYHPIKHKSYWQFVTRDTLQRSKKGGWKLLVPKSQKVGRKAADAWRKAAEGDPYELRMRELRLAKAWMEMLASGSRLVLEFDEWINKSSGRGTVSIGIDHENGRDPEKLVDWHFMIGPNQYSEEIPKLFAWADASLHQETYEDADWDLYDVETRVWGEDDFHSESFSSWQEGRSGGIRPYTNSAGEVDHYRLELTLNELGRAFLVVDGFATIGERQLAP